ncbi:MAG: DUF456 domain-containing protein [Acidobacteriota bacterium]
MEILIVLGIIFLIIGLAGCILPWLAGPPFSFVALILLSIAKKWQAFSTEFLLAMGLLTALAMALDYIVPALGAKKYGASKYGFWGAFLGLVAGVILFPPFGLIIGAFGGAFLGEILAGKNESDALRAGLGVFVGVIFGIAFKLAVSGIMTFYFIKALF